MIIAEWNIQSPARHCAATGQAFQEGEAVVSLLLWSQGAYQRLDYAVAARPEGLPEEADLLSSWTAPYKTPVPPPPETLNKDDAEGLLRRLLAAQSPEYANACYILALMLERKRLVKELDRQTIEGSAVLIYEHVASGETWIIPNPALKLAEMTHVQMQVGDLLQGKGVPPAPGTVVAEVEAEISPETEAGASETEEAPESLSEAEEIAADAEAPERETA